MIYYPTTDNCYELLKQGPCNASEWLVLIEDNMPDALPAVTCQRRPCPSADQVLMKDGQCYWTEYDERTKNFCKKNEKLTSNAFGYADCFCKTDPLHVLWQSNGTESCQPLYGRGLCAEGEYLVPKEGTQIGIHCAPNPCSKQGDDLVPYEEGCYKLGDDVACGTDGIWSLQIDTETSKLKCKSTFSLNSAGSIPFHCGPNSRYRYTTVCQNIYSGK